jgi:TM2 domain-containing membrane protein YozV
MQGAVENPSTCKVTLLAVWLFLGLLGGHRIYTGKYASGFLQMISTGGLGVWWLLDLYFILSGRFTDYYGRRVTAWF